MAVLPTRGRDRQAGVPAPWEACRYLSSHGVCVCALLVGDSTPSLDPGRQLGRDAGLGEGKGTCLRWHQLGGLWLSGTGNLINNGLSYRKCNELTDEESEMGSCRFRSAAPPETRPFSLPTPPSSARWHLGSVGVLQVTRQLLLLQPAGGKPWSTSA